MIFEKLFLQLLLFLFEETFCIKNVKFLRLPSCIGYSKQTI